MIEGKTRRGLALYDHNPFISGTALETKMRRITNKKGDMMIVGKETGEIISSIAGFWQSEEVDSTKFVKLYVNGVKAFKELTGAGTKVFEVLYMEVQKGISKDRIYMSFNTVDKQSNPMSSATYDRGMRELVEKGFIAPSPDIGLFWLNPDYMWNGDRLAFVKEVRKTRSSQHSNQADLFSGSSLGHALGNAAAVSEVPDTADAQDQSSG